MVIPHAERVAIRYLKRLTIINKGYVYLTSLSVTMAYLPHCCMIRCVS